MKLAAPGKVFLAGEYAVLEGEPALVCGVDRALHAEWRALPGGQFELRSGEFALQGQLAGGGVLWPGAVPEALRFAARAAGLAALLCAEEGRAQQGLSLGYLDDFSHQGRKLGLGGSAAASVLAVRAVCAAAGRALPAHEALALALASHWAEQGGSGSGADVAACALGGLVEVRALHHWASPEEALSSPARLLESPPAQALRVAAPPDLRLLLAFTGASADTRALVREVKRYAAAAPSRWKWHVATLSACARELREALEESAGQSGPAPRQAALEAVRRAASAMAALGEAAQVGIVNERLARACALSSASFAAAKPSGAGGGDCAVVFAFGDAARDAAERALQPDYFTLRISPGQPA